MAACKPDEYASDGDTSPVLGRPSYTHDGTADSSDETNSRLRRNSDTSALLAELQKLRDENKQLKHEKSAWAGTRSQIERDLANADAEAHKATERIEQLEVELRKKSTMVETSHWTHEELENELHTLQAQLEKAMAAANRGSSAPLTSPSPPARSRQSQRSVASRSSVTSPGGASVVFSPDGAGWDSDSGHGLWWDDVDGVDAQLRGSREGNEVAPPNATDGIAEDADEEAAQRERVLAEYEATMALYEEELQRQRQAYQDELDEREAEIQRLRLTAAEHKEARPASESDDSDDNQEEESLAEAIRPSSHNTEGSTTDEDEFFDAEGASEAEVVRETLVLCGLCSLEELLERIRVLEPRVDWSAANLRVVLHEMEAQGELLIKIDESGDEPQLLFHASALRSGSGSR